MGRVGEDGKSQRRRMGVEKWEEARDGKERNEVGWMEYLEMEEELNRRGQGGREVRRKVGQRM